MSAEHPQHPAAGGAFQVGCCHIAALVGAALGQFVSFIAPIGWAGPRMCSRRYPSGEVLFSIFLWWGRSGAGEAGSRAVAFERVCQVKAADHDQLPYVLIWRGSQTAASSAELHMLLTCRACTAGTSWSEAQMQAWWAADQLPPQEPQGHSRPLSAVALLALVV